MSALPQSTLDDEERRLATLGRYGVLDTPPEQAFDDLTRLAAQVLGTPIALVSLIDRDRQWFKSRVGIEVCSTPRDMAFCAHAIHGEDVMVVEDALQDPRFANNPLVTGDPFIRFYAGAPLIADDGLALGTLCVIDRQPRRFDATQRETLALLARQVMAQLTLHRQSLHLESLLNDLQERTQLLSQLSNRVPGVIYQYRRFPDGSTCFPYASERMWDMFEVHPEDTQRDAAGVIARVHPQDLEGVLSSIETSYSGLLPWRHEFRVVLPQQGTKWRFGDAVPERLADGSVLWHGFITDITERRLHQERTHRLAYYDPLTGLPNRRLLIDRLERELAHLRRCVRLGALLFIDLDNFKHINDARGHAVGDDLLRQVSQRLTSVLRQDDTVARLGGDEFVVQVGNLDPDIEVAARQARLVAEKVRSVLEGRYEVMGFPYSSTGSIGITLFPRSDGTTVDDLLREADTAMYRAKAGGRNRIEFFEAKMQSEVEERLAMEQDLQLAMAGDQLDVHVQPQVDAQGRIVGGELLMRWQHPQRGNVPPNVFIPLAEESTLILQIGQMVLQRACEALARLQQAGRHWSLSVNVSPRQFRSPDFVECVSHVLKETGADARGLILEVTEGLLIENWQDAVSRMSELVALGLRFSIDDFGTGYSSLAYLKKLPLYELKIDRTFVRDTPGDPNDTAIVEAILSVSQHLGLRVVAEGVETQEQAAFLTSHGCQCLQGYLYARPTPLAGWLDDMLV